VSGDPSVLAAPYLERLRIMRRRLAQLVPGRPGPGALTDPDPDDEEQWDWGQVWAHVAEFPAYWLDQLEAAFAAPRDPPPSFGRTKADPGRMAAIERDRTIPVPELWSRIEPELDRLGSMIEGLSAADWGLSVTHSRLGVLGMPRILEGFLVGHLEEHVNQLERLVG
jgi:hypothetical protein